MRRPLLALLVAHALSACTGSTTTVAADPTLVRAPELPAELQPIVARGRHAFTTLRAALGTRLSQELNAGGPSAAVAVCHDEAGAIAERIGAEHGLRVGRTAARLRNPANAAPTWLSALVARTAHNKAAEVESWAVDLGDRIGLAMPIPTAKACLNCHGPSAQISEGVRTALAAAYPKDRATDFTVGALRGFFWAEIPKTPAAAVAPKPPAPATP